MAKHGDTHLHTNTIRHTQRTAKVELLAMVAGGYLQRHDSTDNRPALRQLGCGAEQDTARRLSAEQRGTEQHGNGHNARDNSHLPLHGISTATALPCELLPLDADNIREPGHKLRAVDMGRGSNARHRAATPGARRLLASARERVSSGTTDHSHYTALRARTALYAKW